MKYNQLKEQLIQKLKQPGYKNHKFSLNRRELLRLGLVAGGGALVPLSFLERAIALTSTKVTTPFLVFDLQGGAALPGNFLAGKKGGPEDLCANYRQHGWNPRASNSLDRRFGLPMSTANSKILQGLLSSLPQEISKNENQTMLKMVSYCHFSILDTNTNRSSAISMISKAGLRGSIVKSSIGMIPSLSGGNSDVYLQDARFKPKAITSTRQLTSLTSFGQDFEELSAKQREQIFARLQEAAGVQSQLHDVYKELSRLGLANPQLDVVQNQEIARLYQINGGGGENEIQAGIVYNVVSGQSGPGVITIGGCDYHDNTQNTGDSKDLEIGIAIGRAVHAAYILKKPLMFQVITDGGIYTNESQNYERIWVGDKNEHSMSILGYFHPTKAVQPRKLQVGHYTDAGTVELNSFVGGGPERMAQGVLVNYLNLHNSIDQFEAVANARLQTNEIDELLVFG